MPAAFATSRCCPGERILGDAKLALRVTVAPEADAYTSSQPPRSAVAGPALAISTYSSEAEAPPVMTSATTNPPDGGQATAAVARHGGRVAELAAHVTRKATSRAKTPRGAGIPHLRRPLRRE
jgi:hypothetical protein